MTSDGSGFKASIVRKVTEQSVDRRIVLKAAAGMSAIAAAGGFAPALSRSAIAQEANSTTRATRFVPSEQGGDFTAAATDEWLTFAADFEFYSLGASWSAESGETPQIELQLSTGDGTWSDSYRLSAQTEDGGPANRDGRIFT